MIKEKDISILETPRLLLVIRDKRNLVLIYGVIAGILFFTELTQNNNAIYHQFDVDWAKSVVLATLYAMATIFLLLAIQQYFVVIKTEREIVMRKDAYAISVLRENKRRRSKENAWGWSFIAILFFITGILLLPYDQLWAAALSLLILGMTSSALCLYSWLQWHKPTLSTN